MFACRIMNCFVRAYHKEKQQISWSTKQQILFTMLFNDKRTLKCQYVVGERHISEKEIKKINQMNTTKG